MKNHSPLPHIRSAIYGTPWAIKSEWLDTISGIFEAHLNGGTPAAFVKKETARCCPNCRTGKLRAEMVAQPSGIMSASGDYLCPNCGCQCSPEDLKPYDVIDGAAILPLTGPLFPKANLLTELSGATSYEEFGEMFEQAYNDAEVNSLFITADSPGGSCLGMAELCNRIFAARESGTKPIVGFVAPMACSAAYAIISQCDEVFITDSAMAGSIGTVLKYNNWDRAERNEGNDAVMLTSSDIKAFGTPQSLAQYQSLIDTLNSYFDQFKEIVARGRPDVDVEKVSGAKVWIGKQAVNLGLCDGIASMSEMLAEMATVEK